MTGMSRNTINKYKDVLDKHPLSYKELIQLSDKELYSIVYPPSDDKPTHDELYGLFPQMDIQLSRIGVTKFMLWEQYKKSYPDGGSILNFANIIVDITKASNCPMYLNIRRQKVDGRLRR